MKHARVRPTDHVLVPYATVETPLPALLRSDASLVIVAPTVADLPALQAQLPKGGAERCRIILDDPTACQGMPAFDAALLVTDAPSARGNDFTFELIQGTLLALRPGGTLWLVGSKRRGVQTFIAHLATLVEGVTTVASGGGARLVQATRLAETSTDRSAVDDPYITVETHGLLFPMRLQPGVFAAHGLDEATALLIETMRVTPDDTLLDLGCGAGAIGLAAALLAPRGLVVLADASPAAVQLAAENLALNGLGNATVVLSDGYVGVGRQRFDVIATNPPFHQHGRTERDVAERFIREAPAHLRPRGRLYVVANAFLPYDTLARSVFRDVQVAAANPRYRVLLCRQ